VYISYNLPRDKDNFLEIFVLKKIVEVVLKNNEKKAKAPSTTATTDPKPTTKKHDNDTKIGDKKSPIAQAFENIRGRVKKALKLSEEKQDVELVAVSKTKPNEALMEAYNLGQRHFGENYVQELLRKSQELPSDIKWHFIGHLQSNKARQLLKTVENLEVLETVDSVKLANTLNRICTDLNRDLTIYVQVNTSGEVQKSGVSPSDCVSLVKHVLNECKSLKFGGLMTIGDFSAEPKPDCFERLRDCRKQVVESLKLDEKSIAMSMGMSADFELAISMGSTSVRVGSALFGARQRKH